MTNKTIEEQLDCAERASKQRKRNYPDMVSQRKMTPEKAQHEIACMDAIITTLEKMRHLEEISEEMKALFAKHDAPEAGAKSVDELRTAHAMGVRA